jgi:hypothetical protein
VIVSADSRVAAPVWECGRFDHFVGDLTTELFFDHLREFRKNDAFMLRSSPAYAYRPKLENASPKNGVNRE